MNAEMRLGELRLGAKNLEKELRSALTKRSPYKAMAGRLTIER
jgi:hypothetical protein